MKPLSSRHQLSAAFGSCRFANARRAKWLPNAQSDQILMKNQDNACRSTLAGLKSTVGFVYNKQPPATSNDAIVTVPLSQRLYRISYFHRFNSVPEPSFPECEMLMIEAGK